METRNTPSKGVFYGAIALLTFCATVLIGVTVGVIKSVSQPPVQSWCEYGTGECKEICQKKELTVIYFYADWCPACRKMNSTTFSDSRVIEKLVSYGRIKANVDKVPVLAQSAKVRGIPTIIVMKGCREIIRQVGNEGPDAFLGFLDGAENIAKDR